MRTASSTRFNSWICITCFLMRSTVGATALLCSGETFRMPMRPSTTCSTSPFSPLLLFEEEEEQEEGGTPRCRSAAKAFGSPGPCSPSPPSSRPSSTRAVYLRSSR